MARGPVSEDPEIPEWLLNAARALGLSPIRTRWQLLRLARRWRSLRSELAPAERRFEHQICGECGALQPDESKICSSCGKALSSPAARFMKSLGLSIPSFISVSSLIGVSMLLIYFRMMIAYPTQGYLRWDTEPLLAHGGLTAASLQAGQWWRIGTANFLHIGILHIGFNLMGLTTCGPQIEEVFGRGRMVFIFLLTGLLAMGVSALFLHPVAVTAGASGALMGLIGAAAGWGQRRRTQQGREVRDQMLKWAAYTMLFGVLVGANHVAHAVGFISGGAIGFAFDPMRLDKTRGSLSSVLMGVVGGLSCAALFMLCMLPPQASRDFAASRALQERQPSGPHGLSGARSVSDSAFRQRVEASCKLLRDGEPDAAMETFATGDTPASDDMLRGTCAYVEHVIAGCERYREAGIVAVMTQADRQNAAQQKTTADYYRVWCDAPP